MNNDLKNFLEVKIKEVEDNTNLLRGLSNDDEALDLIMKTYTEISNFVLDLVQKEVENIENPYSSLDSEWYEGAECMRRDISTVINSLVAYALNVKIGF